MPTGYGRKASRSSIREPKQLVKFGSHRLSKTVSVEVKKCSDMTLEDILPDPSKTFRRKPAAATSTASRVIVQSPSQISRHEVALDRPLHQQSSPNQTLSQQTLSRQTMSQTAAARQLEEEQEERIERIRVRNVYVFEATCLAAVFFRVHNYLSSGASSHRTRHICLLLCSRTCMLHSQIIVTLR